jgi:hypothetical protein
MDADMIPSVDEITELLGTLVGRLEQNTIALNVLVALLEEKGILAPGELDQAVSTFLSEHGREHFVETWGRELGEGLYEGLALKDLQTLEDVR